MSLDSDWACDCECHDDPGEKHVAACCWTCPTCEAHVNFGSDCGACKPTEENRG